MDSFLSVVLPVFNCETHVAQRVADLLEVVSEITSQFELIVVDDGSTDRTSEVLFDLQPSYPQMRIVQRGRHDGGDAALQDGMSAAHGDVVMLYDDDAPISSFEIGRLWELRNDQNLLVARSEPISYVHAAHPVASKRGERDAAVAATPVRRNTGGIQLLRRAAIDRLDPPAGTDVLFPKTTTNRHSVRMPTRNG